MNEYLIILINGSGAPPLAHRRVADYYYGLVPDQCRTGVVWLSIGEAVELHIMVDETSEAEAIFEFTQKEFANDKIDAALLPAQNRRKKLLVADMESTVIAEECLDELAATAGIGKEIAAITERAMRGELDFETALRKRVGLLRGMPVSGLETLRNRLTLLPGAQTLVATMRAHGAYTALVSGGFTFFTEPVAARLGFQVQFANRLGITDGKLDGTVADPILGRAAKAELLAALARKHDLSLGQTLAVGDGANDVEMVKHAGLGIGYRGKPLLASVAVANICHADLTALLYLQGYKREEFVAAV